VIRVLHMIQNIRGSILITKNNNSDDISHLKMAVERDPEEYFV
jgi:hypothetical protein